MIQMPSLVRALGLMTCVAPFFYAPAALGDPLKTRDRVCSAAYENARQLEAAGHLKQATEELLRCTNSTCSALLRQQCSTRYLQLDADVPTVVPLATNGAGEARVNVQVSIDGELLTSRLDGRALPVDPGLHEFSFVADGAVAKTKVMIVQGARNRTVTVSLPDTATAKGATRASADGSAAAKVAPGASSADKRTPLSEAVEGKRARDADGFEIWPPDAGAAARSDPSASSPKSAPEEATATPPPDKTKRGPGVAPYVVGAVGLAGIGAFGLFTYWGRMDNQKLSDCAPYCAPSSVDHIRKMYLAADVSLGVGIAGLGAATTWLLLSSGSPKKERSSPPVALGVAPTPSGGFATIAGSF